MITMRRSLLLLVLAASFSLPAIAQDNLEMGKMWTFEHVPKDYFKRVHGFELTQDWLDSVRLSSLRFGGGCSASFVSSNGLVMTNHHCARDNIAAASPKDQDWVRDGFVAKSMKDEVKLEGLTVQQLFRMDDITAAMNAGIEAGDDVGTINQKRAANNKRIMDAAQKETPNLTPEVVKLYQGGVFMLYRYKFFTDVRLVVAPHLQTAHFGGDPDNFTYPRFGIDFTFCRAYENGKPVDSSKFHFGWDGGGAQKGESVFVTGSPGSTGRLLSKAQLEVLRDLTYPILLEGWKSEMAYIKKLSANDPAVEKEKRPRLLRLENSNKAVTGYLAGLRDASLMRQKATAERALREAVAADDDLSAKYGSAWSELQDIARGLRVAEPKVRLYTPAFGGPALRRAYMALTKSPVDDILKIDTNISEIELTYRAERMEAAHAWLGKADPVYSKIMLGATARESIEAMEEQSIFSQDGRVVELMAQGLEEVRKSSDPAIVAALALIEGREAHLANYRQLKAQEEVQKTRVGQAAFAVYGFSISPDATFTLRLSDGKVDGFPCNGTIAPHQTVFYGLYARNTEFGNVYPFSLPEIWRERALSVDMTKPVNFVSTNDIIGGNSGSPIIDKDKNVVGLVFDGNIEMLSNRFLYRDDIPRSVSVHTAAIEESLVKIYEAQWVLEELKGR